MIFKIFPFLQTKNVSLNGKEILTLINNRTLDKATAKNLQNTIFIDTDFSNVIFNGYNFKNSFFMNCKISNATFINCDLQGTKIYKSEFQNLSIRNCT